MSDSPANQSVALTPAQLLAHWQGHRALTRRVINAFPEDKLFSFSVGGMRTFAVLAMEFVGMAVPGVRGAATGKWTTDGLPPAPKTKDELLAIWDSTTTEIDRLWSQIPPERFQQDDVAYGQWPGKVYWILVYAIDNEIHHRGQGYVYLRALGIEPPPFYER